MTTILVDLNSIDGQSKQQLIYIIAVSMIIIYRKQTIKKGIMSSCNKQRRNFNGIPVWNTRE